PINSDTRNMIQTLILEQYEAMNLGDIDATAPEV
ncbi:MAG: septation protein SpoVG, partial [Anaerostipes sp.]|nr:septation protein SpoVG [Anaerostipes sp.]